jgi:hypothetical protein
MQTEKQKNKQVISGCRICDGEPALPCCPNACPASPTAAGTPVLRSIGGRCSMQLLLRLEQSKQLQNTVCLLSNS